MHRWHNGTASACRADFQEFDSPPVLFDFRKYLKTNDSWEEYTFRGEFGENYKMDSRSQRKTRIVSEIMSLWPKECRGYFRNVLAFLRGLDGGLDYVRVSEDWENKRVFLFDLPRYRVSINYSEGVGSFEQRIANESILFCSNAERLKKLCESLLEGSSSL